MSAEAQSPVQTSAVNQPAKVEQAAIVKAPRERLPFVPRDFDDAWRQADVLAKADLVPKGFKGKPHDILVTILTGAELGVSPMQSLRNIPVINGKGFIESKLKIALILQHPDCLYFDMVESTSERAIFETHRRGRPRPIRFEFTIEDAKKAELLGKDNWRKDPRSMLRARASGQLADIVWPDVTLGVGNKEDLDEADLAKALNVAPSSTFAPPPPIEEAQVAPATPPPPNPKQVFEQAKNDLELKGVQPGEAEPPKRAKHQIQDREPGADEGEEMAAPVNPPASGRESPSDLSLYAQLQAIDPADPEAESKIDAISPEASRVQGPGRQQLLDLMKAKRAAVKKARGGK